ncbi:MAG: glucoamylase family protein, partial [Nitrospirota bacterium]
MDSGNLAGHLLVLGSGLREQADEEMFTPQIFSGLRDTVRILRDCDGENSALKQLDAELEAAPSTLRDAFSLLERATDQATRIAASVANSEEDLKRWARALQRNCEGHLEDLRFLAPWLALPIQRHGVPLQKQLDKLDQAPTLREITELEHSLAPLIDAEMESAKTPHLTELSNCLREAGVRARQRLDILETLARQSDEMAAVDFTFLFDSTRELFSIGFNVSEGRCDASFYDLLASEARLCSYVAIAQGQVPQDHWFSLGRLLVASRGEPLLISWSGSMFEYLMPILVMPNYENTLLDHTYKEAVQRQIAYGKLRDVPWGISESGYNRTDVHLNYQYRAFGVPGLGLKRGLAEDLVIAPYATAMALMIAPVEACDNLQRLAVDRRAGAYGFYEAVDYTPSHLPSDETSVSVQSYMTHHQAMSLLALANSLLDYPMQRRFMACPLLKAADLLLQERVPKTAASVFVEDLTLEAARIPADECESVMRVFTNPTPPAPEVHLLSNGRYHVIISSAGGGYSRWRDLAVTRWREDATCDGWGTFVYLRDLETGDFWSTAYQPTLQVTQGYEAIFTQARAEFRHHHA